MQEIKLVLVGFGNVGQAFLRLLLDKQKYLSEKYGVQFLVTGIATGRHGFAVDSHGINLDEIMKIIEKKEPISRLNTGYEINSSHNFLETIQADVVFENTPVNHTDGQPAIDFITRSLKKGMHVITANKGPVAYAHNQLTQLARQNKVHFLFESTVMDGAPIFSLFRSALPGVNLKGFSGILNSCTNLLIERMENGDSLEEATEFARSIGIAETDPTADIDGFDAAIKVSILCQVLLNLPILPGDVSRQGIRQISQGDIKLARNEGKKWKLMCKAEQKGDIFNASVSPEKVSPVSPLYCVSGTSSAINFETDVLPGLGVIESNPGPQTTAYGLLADLLYVLNNPIIQ